MANSGQIVFSAAEILRIREEWDQDRIRVRAWSDAKGCSPETIRKIGRRDTYRNVQGTDSRVSRRVVHLPDGEREGGLGSPIVRDEMGEQAMSQSLARLQAELDKAPLTARGVDSILDELTKQGAQDA